MPITKYNFIPVPYEQENNELLTEPGLAMDVPTILRRYAQGTLSGLSSRNPYYDDSDFPDPTENPDFDLTDADKIQKEIAERLNHSKENQKNQVGADAPAPAQSSLVAQDLPPIEEHGDEPKN